MQTPRVSKRKIKSAEGLPKNLRADLVLFGRLPLAFFWCIGLSTKGLEPNGFDPKGLEPKGSRVTDMGFVSGSPETVLLPRWSTFLVHTSFLSPKGAGLWTVDWQFQKSDSPQSTETNVRCHVLMPPAAATDDMPHMHCLIFCVF